ncbi:MAG TPA: hypothetical protein VMK05_08730 [Burkholderiales bacterium]|nr:hypothetical protein [Burkholderiales bacterium]
MLGPNPLEPNPPCSLVRALSISKAVPLLAAVLLGFGYDAGSEREEAETVLSGAYAGEGGGFVFDPYAQAGSSVLADLNFLVDSYVSGATEIETPVITMLR